MGRDESVTTSLRELARLEDERRESDRKAAEDAQRKAREARAAAEAIAENERRRVETDRKRAATEEAARHEAMARAAVEQARIEVELRARTEQSDRERRHEIEIERLRAARHASNRLPTILSATVGALVATTILGVLYFAALAPSANARLAAEVDRANAAETRATSQQSQLDGVQRRLDLTNHELADAKIAIEKHTERDSAPSGTTTKKHTQSSATATSKQDKKSPSKTDGPCSEHDPMCFDIAPPGGR